MPRGAGAAGSAALKEEALRRLQDTLGPGLLEILCDPLEDVSFGLAGLDMGEEEEISPFAAPAVDGPCPWAAVLQDSRMCGPRRSDA